MSSFKLYEITEAYRAMACLLEGEEVPPDFEAKLSEIEGNLDAKVNGICSLRQEFLRQSEAAKAESDRLRELSQVRANAAKRLSEYLKAELEKVGGKWKTDLFNCWVQNSPPGSNFEGDAEKLPEPFRRVTYALDGRAAIDIWKAWVKECVILAAVGADPKPCPLPTGVTVGAGTHLRVK